MELAALQNLSPTLLQEMLESHLRHISKGNQIFNSIECPLDISFTNTDTNKRYTLCFEQIPAEIRKGIHDYVTRLTAEKLLIEFVLEK